MEIIIQDKTIYYQVVYSKAKKMELNISPEGHVSVKAPKGSTNQMIEDFLNKNSKILLKLQNRLDNRQYISNKKEYKETENFLYLGQVCKLTDILPDIPDSEEMVRLELKRFYTSKTKEIVKKRVRHFEKLIGVKSKSITIVDTNSTWGTCNNFRELTFNYRLSMAPMSSIDYVVIHELCHILHLNHDRSFWRAVGTYDSNYKEHEQFLDRFGLFMTI